MLSRHPRFRRLSPEWTNEWTNEWMNFARYWRFESYWQSKSRRDRRRALRVGTDLPGLIASWANRRARCQGGWAAMHKTTLRGHVAIKTSGGVAGGGCKTPPITTGLISHQGRNSRSRARDRGGLTGWSTRKLTVTRTSRWNDDGVTDQPVSKSVSCQETFLRDCVRCILFLCVVRCRTSRTKTRLNRPRIRTRIRILVSPASSPWLSFILHQTVDRKRLFSARVSGYRVTRCNVNAV